MIMLRNRIALSFLIGIWFFAINDGQAADNPKWFCATDKETYQQGENVIITITNGSREAVTIVDRTYIDGGFATIERKHSDGTWQPIELYVAANITSFRPLKKGESHRYIWKTVGYNRTDTVAASGAYKITFHQGMISNQFLLVGKCGRNNNKPKHCINIPPGQRGHSRESGNPYGNPGFRVEPGMTDL